MAPQAQSRSPAGRCHFSLLSSPWRLVLYRSRAGNKDRARKELSFQWNRAVMAETPCGTPFPKPPQEAHGLSPSFLPVLSLAPLPQHLALAQVTNPETCTLNESQSLKFTARSLQSPPTHKGHSGKAAKLLSSCSSHRACGQQ